MTKAELSVTVSKFKKFGFDLENDSIVKIVYPDPDPFLKSVYCGDKIRIFIFYSLGTCDPDFFNALASLRKFFHDRCILVRFTINHIYIE